VMVVTFGAVTMEVQSPATRWERLVLVVAL
jgi:hypothetical protein